MPYRFLEEIAIADVAFEATGNTLEELFGAAADAMLNVMVAEPSTVQVMATVEFRLENEALDMLLFDFLNELIFLKDARQLLLRMLSAKFKQNGGHHCVNVVAGGERLDPDRHPLIVDVKAVTLHLFRVEKREQGWQAQVVLDI